MHSRLRTLTPPAVSGGSRTRRGGVNPREAVRGLSWSYVEQSPCVEVWLWQDTSDGGLLPAEAVTIDLSEPWPDAPGREGSADEVAFLLGRWWTVAAEQLDDDHPHEPASTGEGRRR